MTKKKKSKSQLAYEKELKRIKQGVRRLEKRGYEVSQDIIPNKPKKITQGSVRRLQKITIDKLYEKSIAISETGEIVKGTQRRKEEYKLRSLKSAKTRKSKKEKLQKISTDSKENIKFKETIRNKDIIAKEKLATDIKFREKFTEGNIIYQQILDMINEVGKGHRNSANHLLNVLNNEIEKHGKEFIMYCISKAPRMILEACEVALKYGESDGRHIASIREIEEIFRGEILSDDELKELYNIIDSDEMTEEI